MNKHMDRLQADGFSIIPGFLDSAALAQVRQGPGVAPVKAGRPAL